MAAELAGSERPRPQPELSFCGARHRERGTANGEGAVNPDFAVAHWGLGETWRERTVSLAVPVRVDGVGLSRPHGNARLVAEGACRALGLDAVPHGRAAVRVAGEGSRLSATALWRSPLAAGEASIASMRSISPTDHA